MKALKDIDPAVRCKDGTSLSVQGSHMHYCTPRDDDGPYTEMEVGFITSPNGQRLAPPDTWREYADGDFPSTVYGYVPVELIEAFIADHGGRK